jgi:hypothetical protein
MAKKDDNTPVTHNELVDDTQKDWTDEAFPEAHKPDSESGLESKEEEIPSLEEAEVKKPVDDNDTKRYQYWQSQADKVKAENEQLKAELRTKSEPAQVEAQPEPEAKEFPPPPARPRRPRNYSREEAISDPESRSALYNEAVDDWRDKMDKYNNLYAQYNVALAQERMDAIENKVNQGEQEKIAAQQNQQAVSELSDYVQATYGLSHDETQDFIQTMSQPESLSIGNLVDLYKMKGKQVINNVPTQVGSEVDNPEFRSEPSDTFKQVKRAQQVPSPMGVLSGETETKSTADTIMDEMIDTYNKKNPF